MTEAHRLAPHPVEARDGRRVDRGRAGTVARVAGRLAPAGAAAWVVMAVLGSGGLVATAASTTVGVASNATYGTVLTDAQGRALYTYPRDHGGTSACDSNSACASVWPALSVPAGTTPTAGPGVTGTVGEAVQANGIDQVTFNGSPLYTFVGDTAPGQVSGNNVGGFLVVVVPVTPPTTAPAPAPTSAPASPPTTVAVASAPPTTAAPGRTIPTPSAPPAFSPAASPPSAPAPTTAAATSGAAAPPQPGAGSPSTLASTGPGPGLWWVALAGTVLLVAPGTALVLWTRPGAGRRGLLVLRRMGEKLVGR
jgi:predicted lipoprotein with Yx(FWY)xxD motif